MQIEQKLEAEKPTQIQKCIKATNNFWIDRLFENMQDLDLKKVKSFEQKLSAKMQEEFERNSSSFCPIHIEQSHDEIYIGKGTFSGFSEVLDELGLKPMDFLPILTDKYVFIQTYASVASGSCRVFSNLKFDG